MEWFTSNILAPCGGKTDPADRPLSDWCVGIWNGIIDEFGIESYRQEEM